MFPSPPPLPPFQRAPIPAWPLPPLAILGRLARGLWAAGAIAALTATIAAMPRGGVWAGAPSAKTAISQIRCGAHGGFSRVVIDCAGPAAPRVTIENRTAEYKVLYCDLWDVESAWEKPETPIEDPILRSYQAIYLPGSKRVRLAVKTSLAIRPVVLTLGDPGRAVIDLYPASASSPAAVCASPTPSPASPPSPPSFGSPLSPSSPSLAPPAPAKAASPPPGSPASSPAKMAAAPAALSSSSQRKPRIIIDPGHGGWHKGASGRVNGQTIWEKDLTMSMARKLKAILDAQGRYETILSRTQDVYVGLYDRVQFAERREGDLFISLHCNSTDEAAARNRARGLEFWYWSQNGTDSAAARHLEQLENEEGGPGLSDVRPEARRLLSSIMADQLEAQTLQSRKICELAAEPFLRLPYFRAHYRGIRSARFKVLENYQMPAILVEAGFLSHPAEAQMLADSKFQNTVAQCLAEGIAAAASRVLENSSGSPLGPIVKK